MGGHRHVRGHVRGKGGRHQQCAGRVDYGGTVIMPEWIFYLVGQAFTAGAIYGAIRGDIKGAAMKADTAHESATEAHQRIDALLLKGKS